MWPVGAHCAYDTCSPTRRARSPGQLRAESTHGEDALAGKTWHQRDLLQKKAWVIAYMFEALYDVLLSPASNVSRSPGFEKMLAGGGQ